MRPWFITTTRSATSIASSWSWVTKTLVTCISSCRRRSQRRSSLRTLASSAPNGSSSSSTLRLDGERARQRDALALAAGELVRVAVGEPVELHQLEQLRRPCADRALGRPRRLAAARAGRTRRSRRSSCGRTARSAGTRSRRWRSRTSASVASSPWNSTLPVSGTSSPAMMRSSVVLPEPDGPSSATSSPAGMSRFRSSQTTVRAEALVEVADFDAHAGFHCARSGVALACTRRSTDVLQRPASPAPAPASSEATANAAANWYSL